MIPDETTATIAAVSTPAGEGAIALVRLSGPQAILVANAAWDAVERVGLPECQLSLSQAVLYLALAPKSNAAYQAFGEARDMARETGSLMPPMHILNAPTRLMRDLGYGKGYVYDHATEEGFSGQNYFPDGVPRQNFYRPGELNDPQNLHRYHFWSLHPGGGNWLFADGAVRFISYAAGTQMIGNGLTLLEAMASRSGSEPFDMP